MVAKSNPVTMVLQDTLDRSYSRKVTGCSVFNLLSTVTLGKDELPVVHLCHIVKCSEGADSSYLCLWWERVFVSVYFGFISQGSIIWPNQSLFSQQSETKTYTYTIAQIHTHTKLQNYSITGPDAPSSLSLLRQRFLCGRNLVSRDRLLNDWVWRVLHEKTCLLHRPSGVIRWVNWSLAVNDNWLSQALGLILNRRPGLLSH